ncbi:hypothetical protein GJAV_G00196320 [Gymnothorax javanicus]|nr:hypothetical protein GJAV_G00196320 [Gymnothorax javanicus]
MSALIYVDKENGALRTPAPSKQRGRLFSAPADACLKTPALEKPRFGLAPQSGRRALGTVNKVGTASCISTAGRHKKKTAAIPTQVKPQETEEEYPEIEKLLTYDPREFETYEVPEEVRLSHLCLAGLGRFPSNDFPPEEEFEMIVGPPPSPMKAPTEDYSAELDAFLQTIKEITIELPPEPEY